MNIDTQLWCPFGRTAFQIQQVGKTEIYPAAGFNLLMKTDPEGKVGSMPTVTTICVKEACPLYKKSFFSRKGACSFARMTFNILDYTLCFLIAFGLALLGSFLMR